MAKQTASEAGVIHATFTLERTYPVPPARVFAAWATPAAKSRWFAGPDGWKEAIREMDFRPGGSERVRGEFADGHYSDFIARYHVITPDEKIIYAYDMHASDRFLSVSLATIQFAAAGTGTKLTMTEQGVFFGTMDDVKSREHGTAWLLEKVGAALT